MIKTDCEQYQSSTNILPPLQGEGRGGVIFFLICFLIGLAITGHLTGQPVPLTIGISKASPNYVNWLKRTNPEVLTIDLYAMPIDKAVQTLGVCGGLLLTGGEDVWPGRYGKEADTARCTEMNPHRDTLDMALIEKALSLKMPIIGVCRGHQILNVYLGGTLVIDIPDDVGSKVIHQCDDYLKCFHQVRVKKASTLSLVTGCDSAAVTTNHHQAVELLSTQLAANAFSSDQLIEGIEWRNPTGKSFLLGVQWHPERMDTGNPLSAAIATEFLRQAVIYSTKR